MATDGDPGDALRCTRELTVDMSSGIRGGGTSRPAADGYLGESELSGGEDGDRNDDAAQKRDTPRECEGAQIMASLRPRPWLQATRVREVPWWSRPPTPQRGQDSSLSSAGVGGHREQLPSQSTNSGPAGRCDATTKGGRVRNDGRGVHGATRHGREHRSVTSDGQRTTPPGDEALRGQPRGVEVRRVDAQRQSGRR